jgi:hypothetical protein
MCTTDAPSKSQYGCSRVVQTATQCGGEPILLARRLAEPAAREVVLFGADELQAGLAGNDVF